MYDRYSKIRVPDTLVDDNTNGSFGDIVDTASFSVIKFMWHALLNGSITLFNKDKLRISQQFMRNSEEPTNLHIHKFPDFEDLHVR